MDQLHARYITVPVRKWIQKEQKNHQKLYTDLVETTKAYNQLVRELYELHTCSLGSDLPWDT